MTTFATMIFTSSNRSRCKIVILMIALLLVTIGCSQGFRGKQQIDQTEGLRQVGLASYYASSLQGQKTASGEPYDRNSHTAAHRSLPFGTEVQVRNLKSGKMVTVRINDRGPFADDRIIDLSHVAAKDLGLLQQGVAKVEIVERKKSL